MSSDGVYGICSSGRSGRPVAVSGCGVCIGGGVDFGFSGAGLGGSVGTACCLASGFDWAKSVETKRAVANADVLLMTRESIASRRHGAATDRLRTMSRTSELLIYGAFFAVFLLLYFTLGFRKARPRADGRTPTFQSSSAGEYGGFRYTVARTRLTRGSLNVPMNASGET